MKFTDTDIENVLANNGWSATSRETLLIQLRGEREVRKHKEKGLVISLNNLALYYLSVRSHKDICTIDAEINGDRYQITDVRINPSADNNSSRRFLVVSEGRVYYFGGAAAVRQFGAVKRSAV